MTSKVSLKGISCAVLLGLSASVAGAVDLKDLAPCKLAAVRYCDRSGGTGTESLQRCGATLAARSAQVSTQCREVLRRYGQL